MTARRQQLGHRGRRPPGIPLLVLPFSTDQFAGAAAIERAGFGEVLDPNAASVAQISAAVERLLELAGPGREVLRTVRTALQQDPGPARAYRATVGDGNSFAQRGFRHAAR